MTAVIAIGMLTLALAALWFAGEAKDAKVENAALRVDLAQARATRDALDTAAKDELARLKAERKMYVDRLQQMEDAIASSPDPVARRAHLRELGKLLTDAGKPR